MARVGIDWDAEGLLDEVEGEAARAARIALLEKLHAEGVELEELHLAAIENRLAILPVERVLSGDRGRYTLAEVAERSGLEPRALRRHLTALGLPLTEGEDQRLFGGGDVEMARAAAEFRAAGLPEEGMLEVARVIGIGSANLAAAIQRLFGEALIRPGDTELDLAERYERYAAQLMPRIGVLIAEVLRVHQRELLRRAAIGGAELASGRLADSVQMAVCFADLVGFTRLGEAVPADELGMVAGRLTELAIEVARPPVSLVKMIGDAAMLVSPEPEPLLEAALTLVEAADGEAEGFPQIKAGVALGELLGRGGDWYGAPVNLASRITGVARPGSVLATAELRDAVAAPGFAFSMVRPRLLKGVGVPVRLFRVRRAGGGTEGEGGG